MIFINKLDPPSSLWSVREHLLSFLELPRHSWPSECRDHTEEDQMRAAAGGSQAARRCSQGIHMEFWKSQVESSHMHHTAPKPSEATLEGILGFEAHR